MEGRTCEHCKNYVLQINECYRRWVALTYFLAQVSIKTPCPSSYIQAVLANIGFSNEFGRNDDYISPQPSFVCRGINVFLRHRRQSFGSTEILRHSMSQTQNCELSWILSITAVIYGTDTGNEVKNLTFSYSLFLVKNSFEKPILAKTACI